MKKYNNNTKKRFIPNILTLVNMFLGFLSIGLILNGMPLKAGIFILVAALFDAFDGKIARLLGIDSKFGLEFDSMADTVSFCVVPSILIYSLYVTGLPAIIGGFISFIPLMFGTIRLAKFNLSPSDKNLSYFIGLPTPIATITLFSYLFFNNKIFGNIGDPRTALMLTFSMAVLMISPIPFAKFPLFSFHVGTKNSISLILFFISLLLLYFFRGYVLLPISLTYIIVGIIKWLSNPHRYNDNSNYNVKMNDN
jgi:CDP-diacylglycerol--serine O-phosphatidyltransferase